MRIKRWRLFWLGIFILGLVLASYFISINAEEGANYVVRDNLLGIIIFHNPFILGLYVLIGVVLIVKGFS